jgi:hypothetical protein
MFGEPQGTVRLLDAEPSLARGIERRVLDDAREKLSVEVRRVEPGPWEGSTRTPPSPLFIGYLILEGAFTRQVEVSGRPSIELLGPGDLVRPWVVPRALDAMGVTDEWALISTGHLAMIDEEFHQAAQGFPSILTLLMDRVVARSRWLGFHVALCQLPRIDHRLLLIFRYVAERWGVEEARGVKIPIRLSHRNLAAMIGARRPKVSSALTTLAESGVVQQAPDGSWTFFAAGVDPLAVLAGIDDPTERIGA